MQTFTLIVQNAVSRESLGTATSTAQFSRSAGATLGTSIFGTIMTGGLKTEIPKHLPQGATSGAAAQKFSGGGGGGLGAALDPSSFGKLPEAVVTGIREGFAAAMHPVFVTGLPIIRVALLAAIFVKELPLKTVANIDADKGSLAENAAGVSAGEAAENGASTGAADKTDCLVAGATLASLSQQVESANGESPELLSAAAGLVESNGHGASERERAGRANREIIKPLSSAFLLDYMLNAKPPREGVSDAKHR